MQKNNNLSTLPHRSPLSKVRLSKLNDQFKRVINTPLALRQVNEPVYFFATSPKTSKAVTRKYIDIREKYLLLVIDEVDAHSTAGPDGFSAIFLKSCKCAQAKLPQILF